jgi:hypothetical protein
MPIDNSKYDCRVWLVWGLTAKHRMDLVAICSTEEKRDQYVNGAERRGYIRVETEKCLLDHLFGSRMLAMAQQNTANG